MNIDSITNKSENKEKSQKKNKLITGAFLKILINFFQFLAVITKMKINFNGSFYTFVTTQKIFSGSIFDVISLECLFPSSSLKK